MQEKQQDRHKALRGWSQKKRRKGGKKETPGGLVVRTRCFHCCGLGSILVEELRS